MKNLTLTDKLQEQPDILLVEDNDDDAELVVSVFEKNNMGNSILRLRSGTEVINYFLNIHSGSASSLIPKIILLDYKLPGMDGISLLKRLRTNENTRHVPVMLFTGFQGGTTAFESYRLGITNIISKNATYEALEKSLMEVQLYLNHFKILIVDDSRTDAQMIEDALHSSKIQFTAKIATNELEYLEALSTFKPDVIFCDYDLKKYDAIRAVRTLKALNMNIPLIMVTGQLSENFACGCLSEGIKDYLLKSNLTRLPSTLVSALRKKKIEDENSIMHEKLKIAYNKLVDAQEISHLGNWELNFETGKAIWSDEACKIYGLTPDENEQTYESYLSFVHPEDLEALKSVVEKSFESFSGATFDYRIIRRDGTVRIISAKSKFQLNKEGKAIGMYGICHDITEIKRAEQEIKKNYHNLEQIVFAISHKVRQPIANILGVSNLLDKSIVAPGEVKKIIDYMKESILALDTFTKDLTSFVNEVQSKKTLRY